MADMIALEYGNAGIRAFNLKPGFVATERVHTVRVSARVSWLTVVSRVMLSAGSSRGSPLPDSTVLTMARLFRCPTWLEKLGLVT